MTRAFAVAYDYLFSYGPLFLWEECIIPELFSPEMRPIGMNLVVFSPEMRGLDLDGESGGGERSHASSWRIYKRYISLIIGVYPRHSYPSMCGVGIFVIDSFATIRGEYMWQAYMGTILLHVWQRTGMRCLALVLPGASFRGHEYHDAFQVVQQSFKTPQIQFMVWMATGNDMYPIEAPPAYAIRKTCNSIESLFNQSAGGCQHLLVFGGSSATWQYDRYQHEELARRYDIMCKAVRGYVREKIGIPCINGGDLMFGIRTVDKVAHVSSFSIVQLKHIFVTLTRWGMVASRPASKL